MADRLRIARSEIGAYSLPAGVTRPDREAYRRIVDSLRRHLPPAVATVLAEPVVTADGRYIDWFTPLAGQPVPLSTLSGEARRRALKLLEDRLSTIRALAARPELIRSEELVRTLRQATTYPPEDVLYVVDGQPVVTFWGYGELPPDPPPVTAGPQRSGWLRWFVTAVVAGTLLGALAWAAWHSSLLDGLFDRTDYAALLAAERAQGEGLRRDLLGRQTQLAEALGTCALQTSLDVLRSESALLSNRLAALKEETGRALAFCAAQAELERLKAESAALAAELQSLRKVLSDRTAACRDQALAEARAEQRRLKAKLKALREKLKVQLQACHRPSPAAKPSPAKPLPPEPAAQAVPAAPAQPPKPEQAAKPNALPPCPGERPPEDAPDVAVVLDASGSMRIPSVLDSQSASVVREFESCMTSTGLMGQVLCAPLFAAYEMVMNSARGPSRLQSAQQSVSSVVSSLPADVDVALAVLEDCPRATDFGLFDHARRGRLLQTVHALTPRQGTPLADGLLQAARKVDGVRAPAVMVVVSDGKDSCGGNPCAAAASLKAAKPKLKINVVDIVGDGAVNCIANMTGGDVLTPRSGLNLDQLVRRAASEAQKPEHCK